jgi:DNA-binding GntR family transcriptional regulator
MASDEKALLLVDAVYARLRHMIVTSALPAGQKLVERDLAEQLGVSRTPVREALGLLAASGLVETRARRGYHVPTLSAGRVSDLYEFRKTLEVDAARLAAARATPSDLTEIDALLLDVDGLAPEVENHARAVRLDMRLHALIARASGNMHLHQAICGVLDKVMCFLSVEIGDRPSLSLARDQHIDLLRAIARRDAAEAAAIVGFHIEAARDSLIRTLKAREDLQSLILSDGDSWGRDAAGQEPDREIQQGALA